LGTYGGQGKQFYQCQGDYPNIIKKIYLQQLENQKMQRYITLLKANKNLILTGAPGTGKTFLAKEIEKKLIGILNGHAWQLHNYPLLIPQNLENWNNFIQNMRREEQKLSDMFKHC
jgi:DNA replication protein DnaC